jgi:hypothetical protein
LKDVLADIVETTAAPWDPYARFLRARIGNPEGRESIIPSSAQSIAALRNLRDAALDDESIELVRRIAIRLVAPRFAQHLDCSSLVATAPDRVREILRGVGWMDEHGEYRNREALFCVAADALQRQKPRTIAGLITADVTAEEAALLKTVAAWSQPIAAEIADDLRSELGASRDADRATLATRLERQLKRIRILADAARDVAAFATELLEWALAAGLEHRAADVLQQSGDQHVESYLALTGRGLAQGPLRIVLNAIRRLVEAGAPTDDLPTDMKLAIRAALPKAISVREIEGNERATRLWLWMVGPDLSEAQRDLLHKCVVTPRPTQGGMEIALEAGTVLKRAGERSSETGRMDG